MVKLFLVRKQKKIQLQAHISPPFPARKLDFPEILVQSRVHTETTVARK